jgi:hypothetical protein
MYFKCSFEVIFNELPMPPRTAPSPQPKFPLVAVSCDGSHVEALQTKSRIEESALLWGTTL